MSIDSLADPQQWETQELERLRRGLEVCLELGVSRLWEAQQQQALKLGDATLLSGVPLDLRSLSGREQYIGKRTLISSQERWFQDTLAQTNSILEKRKEIENRNENVA